MSDSFFHLGPDAALAAAEAAGFAPTGHCTPLTCLENRVYDLRLESEEHVVVKFYRPGRWSREAILEEHAFLEDLRGAEVPVCAPLALQAAGGTTLMRHAGLHTAIWPRTGGRSPDELDDAGIERLGRLLARIHNVGAVRGAPARPRFDSASRIHDPLEVLERVLPPSCARRYGAAARGVAEHFDHVSRGVPVHRIHGDCHFGNLLQRDDEWFFLDFDDFGIGPAAQDLWMLCPGRDAEGLRQRARLVAAYRQLRDFDECWLELVEPLRAMRFVWYAAWIARRFADPAFPNAFPHFGSEEYWERETRDLEEQLERIRGARFAEPARAEAGPGAAAEPELRNEDFFWDL